MAGPRAKKPPGTAADPRNGQKALRVHGNFNAVPYFPPPEGLTQPAVDAWEGFWSDRPSQLLTPSARNVLLRWVDALNRYMIFMRRADMEPLLETGQHGQLGVNPAYKIASDALQTVQWCERQLGIGTLHATALGLAAIAEARSITDLNARYSQPSTTDLATDPHAPATLAAAVDHLREEEDPRRA